MTPSLEMIARIFKSSNFSFYIFRPKEGGQPPLFTWFLSFLSFNEQILVLRLKNEEKNNLPLGREVVLKTINFIGLTYWGENQGHKQEYYRARTQACEPWPQGSLSFLHGPCPHSEAWFGEAKVKQQSLTSLSCWDWTLTPTTEMSTTKQHGHQKAYKYNVPKSKPMLRKIHSLNLYEYPETIIITEVRLSCENWEVPDYHSPIQGDPNGGSKAQDDNGTREHLFEGVGQSKGTPAYVKGPGPPCLPVPHQELASNQRNASVTTTRLTSTLGASTHWW